MTADDGGDDAAGMPIGARVHLAHAVVQHLADDAGVDLLHIKGPAFLPDLRPPESSLQRRRRPGPPQPPAPASSPRWSRSAGSKRTDFATGSVFAHAANWWHDDWGWVDVHVQLARRHDRPRGGVRRARRGRAPPAHRPHRLPGARPHRPAPRAGAPRGPLHRVDPTSTTPGRARTTPSRLGCARWPATLDAEVALAAGLGELEHFRDHPTYALWRHVCTGGSRLDEWRARLKAAPTARARAELVAGVFRVNRDHLGMELGRPPTRQDLRRAPAPARTPCRARAHPARLGAVVMTTYPHRRRRRLGQPRGPRRRRPARGLRRPAPHGPPVSLEGSACLVWLAVAEGGTLEEILGGDGRDGRRRTRRDQRRRRALLDSLVAIGLVRAD